VPGEDVASILVELKIGPPADRGRVREREVLMGGEARRLITRILRGDTHKIGVNLGAVTHGADLTPKRSIPTYDVDHARI
jgi:hypothetical protein